jgi:hypothetical protein
MGYGLRVCFLVAVFICFGLEKILGFNKNAQHFPPRLFYNKTSYRLLGKKTRGLKV